MTIRLLTGACLFFVAVTLTGCEEAKQAMSDAVDSTKEAVDGATASSNETMPGGPSIPPLSLIHI